MALAYIIWILWYPKLVNLGQVLIIKINPYKNIKRPYYAVELICACSVTLRPGRGSRDCAGWFSCPTHMTGTFLVLRERKREPSRAAVTATAESRPGERKLGI